MHRMSLNCPFQTPFTYLYERLEQLEQLRFLENGIPVRMVEVTYPDGLDAGASGVDTPEDLARAAAILAKLGGALG